MKRELSDMLTDAKADPPPPRYTVDDAVNAGRRLQKRRRRAVWTGATAVAVVAGVVAAITVPRVVTDRQPSPPSAGLGPAASPSVRAATYPDGLFDGNIVGFVSGAYKVTGTVHVTPGYQVAVIVGPADGPGFEDSSGKMHEMLDSVGKVIVYRPGAFDPAKARTGKRITIEGRVGFYQEAAEPGLNSPDTALSWEYADNAWAVIMVHSRIGLTRAQIEDFAASVRFRTAQPVKVGFRLGYVPKGFELAAAGVAEGGLGVPLDGQSYVRLLKGDFPYRGLTEPPIDSFVVKNRELPIIQLTVYPSWWTDDASPRSGPSRGKPYCAEANLCYRFTGDGKFAVEVKGSGAVPDSQLIRMLQELTFADPTDRATWFDATEAVG